MAAVSQNPVLFSGSVKYNIAYGLHDCTIERVKEAAMKANAHDFICRLQEGYDTGEIFSYQIRHHNGYLEKSSWLVLQ